MCGSLESDRLSIGSSRLEAASLLLLLGEGTRLQVAAAGSFNVPTKVAAGRALHTNTAGGSTLQAVLLAHLC